MLFRDLRVPVVQAPIEATVELAAAVCNTGGMGSLGFAWTTADEASRLVETLRSTTPHPFFVNFVLSFEPHAFDAAIEAGAPAITLSWGLDPSLIERAHRHNVAVGVQVGTTDGAKAAINHGADFIICQGVEAGGHVQSTTPLSKLLTGVLETAKDIPVIATGGLADSDDIEWVLKQGATAAMLGTRFVASEESAAHPLYKEALVMAASSDTVYTTCFDGGWAYAAHRVIRNQLFNLWESCGCPQHGSRPGEGEILSISPAGHEVPKYAFNNPMSHTPVTDVSEWCLYAGLGCDKITDVPSAAELVQRLSPTRHH